MKTKEIKCRSCDETENLHIHQRYLHMDGTFGIRYTCRKCNADRMRKYLATPSGKERAFAATYRSIDANRAHHNARVIVYRHVRKGTLEKPKVCSSCQLEKNLEGHHKDYSKPLNVTWLCRQCHADEHRRMRLIELNAN